MTLGPIVAGVGMLLFMRVDTDASYAADVLPAVLVFGLGLSATVAPLTATVLDSVAERRVGIASGINNGVSRVAGLLAIAVLGAVISAHFGARLDSDARVGRDRREPAAARRASSRAIAEAKEQPLGVPDTERPRPRRGAADRRRRPPTPRPRPSTSARCWPGLLMILGGIAAGDRHPEPAPPRRGGEGPRGRERRGRARN